MDTEKKSNKKTILIIILIAGIAAIAFAVFLFVSDSMKLNAESEKNEEVAAEVREPEPPQVEASPEEPEAEVSQPEVDIPIDFAALKEKNSEIYAWIEVPGTNIDYPVVRSGSDDSYYLTHNAYDEKSASAAIFTEKYNKLDFSDRNTVIYGHNMKDGSMFASLHSYEDKGFFDENRTIIIYTPEKILKYRVFAAYESGDENLAAGRSFDDDIAFERYINGVFNIRDMKANIDKNVEIGLDDCIITLSTCVRGQDENRYLVQAVLTDDE